MQASSNSDESLIFSDLQLSERGQTSTMTSSIAALDRRRADLETAGHASETCEPVRLYNASQNELGGKGIEVAPDDEREPTAPVSHGITTKTLPTCGAIIEPYTGSKAEAILQRRVSDTPTVLVQYSSDPGRCVLKRRSTLPDESSAVMDGSGVDEMKLTVDDGDAGVAAVSESANEPPRSSAKAALLAVADCATALLVFGMLSIIWWRGIWNLLLLWAGTTSVPTHCLLTLTGWGLNIIGYLCYAPLHAWRDRVCTCIGEQHHVPYTSKRTERWWWWLLYGAAKRGVSLVRIMGYVLSWVGIWTLLDMVPWLSDNPIKLWCVSVAGITALAAMRQLGFAVLSLPFSVVLDSECDDAMDTSLRFCTHEKPSRACSSWVMYVLDIWTTSVLPDVASVFAWYGISTWIYTTWPIVSSKWAVVYLVVSIALCAACFAMEVAVAAAVRRVEALYGRGKVAVTFEYVLGAVHLGYTFIALIAVWTIVESMINEYFFPRCYVMSNVVCLVGGLGAMFVLNVAASEVAPGFEMDGDEGVEGWLSDVRYWPEVISRRRP